MAALQNLQSRLVGQRQLHFNPAQFVQEQITRSWLLTLWLIILTYVTVRYTIGQLIESPVITAVILVLWAATVAMTVINEVTRNHTAVSLWLKNNLYNSITNTLLSLLLVLLIIAGLRGFIGYAFVRASFSTNPEVAQATLDQYENPGANWGAVIRNMRNLMVFRFPRSETWRVWAVPIMLIVLVIPSFFVYRREKYRQSYIRSGLTILWLLSPLIIFSLLLGVVPQERFNWLSSLLICLGIVVVLIGIWIATQWAIGQHHNKLISIPLAVIATLFVGGIVYSLVTFALTLLSSFDLTIPSWIKVTGQVGTTLLAVIIMAVSSWGAIRNSNARTLVVIGASAVWLAILYGVMMLLFAIFDTSISPEVSWGGLLLTLIISVFAIVASFPLGLLLALGRRSQIRGIPAWLTWTVAVALTVGALLTNTPENLANARTTAGRIFAYWPLLILLTAYLFQRYFKGNVVAVFSTIYIECVRGVPFITVLFMSIILFPIFLPPGMEIIGTWRVMAATAMFAAAYLAENVRGGLQSIPKGQYEAADALGLNTFQKYRLIILPQALRAVIPAIVGQFIGLFKDTTLVAIVGLVDLLGAANLISAQPDWLGVRTEPYIFLAFIYFLGSAVMAGYSRRLEAQLGVGER